MKKYSKILALILTFILALSFTTLTIADVGDFESYDSDWGGSDWSSSDWGSSSWDSDWSSSDYDSSSSENGSFFPIILTVIIILIIYYNNNNKNKPSGPNRRNMTYTSNNNTSSSSPQKVLSDIRAVDEFFNEDKFLAWAKSTFVKLQECWTKRNWEEIRTFETEELFEQHSTFSMIVID